MYQTVEEILWPKNDFVCAGSGQDLGVYFLERFFEASLTVTEAMALMGFVMREVKDSVGGVGRETEFVSLTQSGMSRRFQSMAFDSNIPPLSECMKRFWKRNQHRGRSRRKK